jgi:hypothetical protein
VSFFFQYRLCMQQNSTVRAVRPTAAPTIMPAIAPLPSPLSEPLFGGEVAVGETCSLERPVEDGVASLIVEVMVAEREIIELIELEDEEDIFV